MVGPDRFRVYCSGSVSNTEQQPVVDIVLAVVVIMLSISKRRKNRL